MGGISVSILINLTEINKQAIATSLIFNFIFFANNLSIK